MLGDSTILSHASSLSAPGSDASCPRPLVLQPLCPETFDPYGQVIAPLGDGVPFGPQDAQLVLTAGQPRFYIMRLLQRGRRFERITRHRRCTQCLGALGGMPWFLAVAPPSVQPEPDLEQLQAFVVPGDCFIKLHVGTWHAGPYFDAEQVDFYNLELSDTNVVDHDTFSFGDRLGLSFELVEEEPLNLLP